MEGNQFMSWVFFVIRCFVALVFMVSGVLKAWDPGRFLLDVQAFALVPYPLEFVSSLMLPWLEIFGAFALLLKRCYAAALFMLGALTVFFIGLITWAESNGTHLNCGCFGEWLVFPDYYSHVSFNCLLLAGLVVLAFQRFRQMMGRSECLSVIKS